MKGPGSENSLAKKAKKMKYPPQLSDKDYGGSTAVSLQKVQICSSGPDKKCYGSRAIAVKGESLLQTLTQITEADEELAVLPDMVVGEIKSNIRKGAKDLEQQWKDALELTTRAYYVTGIRLPTPLQSKAWKQYEELIAFAVKQMAATRGLDSDWRLTTPNIQESTQYASTKRLPSKRFFWSIAGAEEEEVIAKDMDEIIDRITNKIRASRQVHGAKVRVTHRSPHGAKLMIVADGEECEEVVIKQHS